MEDGTIIFVGATTENPSFHLTTPLLSRSRVLSLSPLQPHHIKSLIQKSVEDAERGLQLTTQVPVSVDEDAAEFLSVHCDGDARVALNALEVAATLAANKRSGSGKDGGAVALGVAEVKEAMQCKHLAYDRDGEEHYNLISALHKSMRGSDPDAAIYWLARMLEGGEKPLYIARRLVRFASEDVGLADPAAMGQAVACYQACHFLGMPECDVNLAQCVAYLALAPKSVAVYKALGKAKSVVKESVGGNEGVPLHLRNAPTKLMKEFGYGEGYLYPPDHPESACSQTYLPPSLQGHRFLDWPQQQEKKPE
ncbi:ATPase WRNIP1 [Iris pallida]|uniref:ATPase WRNIP1 n=1 Tax=Iris pallida TaxID=29817 RepID=A0AAX6EDF7_IRIPA|nr:ATPase WRNIP1 [Iris pallida]